MVDNGNGHKVPKHPSDFAVWMDDMCFCGHPRSKHTLKDGTPTSSGCIQCDVVTGEFCGCGQFTLPIVMPEFPKGVNLTVPMVTEGSNVTWSGGISLKPGDTISFNGQQMTVSHANDSGTTVTMKNVGTVLPVDLPPEASFTAAQLLHAKDYAFETTKIGDMTFNGFKLEHLMCGYLKYMMDTVVEDAVQARVKELEKTFKAEHKRNCIPSFKRNERKFRA